MARVSACLDRKWSFIFHIAFWCFTLAPKSTFAQEGKAVIVTSEEIEAIQKAVDEYQEYLKEVQSKFRGTRSDPVHLKKISKRLAEKLGTKLFDVSLEADDYGMCEMRNSAIAVLDSHPEMVKRFFVDLIENGGQPFGMAFMPPKHLESLLLAVDFSKVDLGSRRKNSQIVRLRSLFVDSAVALPFKYEAEVASAKQLLKLEPRQRKEFRSQYLKLWLLWPSNGLQAHNEEMASKLFASHDLELTPEFLNWVVLDATLDADRIRNAADYGNLDRWMLVKAIWMIKYLDQEHRPTKPTLLKMALEQRISVTKASQIWGQLQIATDAHRSFKDDFFSEASPRQMESLLPLIFPEDSQRRSHHRLAWFLKHFNERGDLLSVSFLEALAVDESHSEHVRSMFSRSATHLNNRLAKEK